MPQTGNRDGQLLSDKILGRYFAYLLRETREVPGDVVECGVGHGYSLSVLAEEATMAGRNTIWGYDSFEGLPKLGSYDYGIRRSPRGAGDFKSTPGEAMYQVSWRVGTLKNIKLRKSWFADLKPDDLPYQVALLHLDVDLYESYKTCLNLFWGRIPSGGIVALDEYGDIGWPGCKQAVDEFLQEHPESYRLEWYLEAQRSYLRRVS